MPPNTQLFPVCGLWYKKEISQPSLVEVLLLTMMTEVYHFHHEATLQQ